MPASSTAAPAPTAPPPAPAPASNSINMAGNIGSNNCLPTAAIFSRFVGHGRVVSQNWWEKDLPGDSYAWGTLSLPANAIKFIVISLSLSLHLLAIYSHYNANIH